MLTECAGTSVSFGVGGGKTTTQDTTRPQRARSCSTPGGAKVRETRKTALLNILVSSLENRTVWNKKNGTSKTRFRVAVG